MTRVAGVDGCKAGWYVAVWDIEDRHVQGHVCPTFPEVLRATHDCNVVAVDVPIGLPDRGPRLCDVEARRLLKGKASSVFPAPLRAMFRAKTRAEASAIRQGIDGKGVGAQAFAIVKKVREMDEAMSPELQRRVVEIHPELCFWGLTGAPILESKRADEGFTRRRVALRAVLPDFEGLLLELKPSQVANDDVLDALVAAWTARRVLEGAVGRIPSDDPPVDAHGLRMEMWF